MEKIVIIGAGLIGASLAFFLSRQGRAVTVVEAGLPAGQASGRSFGWINASYALSDAHFALRVAGMAAHERLSRDLPGHHRTSGCLCWEETGEAFAATTQKLQSAGYPLERLDRAALIRREPALRQLPDEALLFPTEGWLDAAALTRDLLSASGARVLSGVHARPAVDGHRTRGVATDLGLIPADQVVIAAGLGTTELLMGIGLHLPMLHRPALVLRTKPVAVKLSHILAAPEQEIRQEPDGRLLAPVAASHQSDPGLDLMNPLDQADTAMRRIAAILGVHDIQVDRVIHALRPVPGDGLPVLGRVPGVDGLWLAVLHSGVTLAAIVAEGLGGEILGQSPLPVIKPFRPDRILTAI